MDGNILFLVIIDLYAELTRAIPAARNSAKRIGTFFLEHWIMLYATSCESLTDKEAEFGGNSSQHYGSFLEWRGLQKPLIISKGTERRMLYLHSRDKTLTLRSGAPGRLRPVHAASNLCAQYTNTLRD